MVPTELIVLTRSLSESEDAGRLTLTAVDFGFAFAMMESLETRAKARRPSPDLRVWYRPPF